MGLSESALAWCYFATLWPTWTASAPDRWASLKHQHLTGRGLSRTFHNILCLSLSYCDKHQSTPKHTHTPIEHLNKHSYLCAAIPVNQGEWSSLRVTDRGSWCSLPAQSWTETCTPLLVPPCCPWTGSSLDTKWLHVTEPVRISLCRLSHLLATVASISVCCGFCSASRGSHDVQPETNDSSTLISYLSGAFYFRREMALPAVISVVLVGFVDNLVKVPQFHCSQGWKKQSSSAVPVLD